MVSKAFFLCVVLVFGLWKTDARLNISLSMDSKNTGLYIFTISCTASDVDDDAKTVDFLQILKDDSGAKPKMIANIGKDDNIWGNTLKSDYDVEGQIDGDSKKNSNLKVTLKNPDHEDEGQYVCDIYYTDKTGTQQHISSSASLRLPTIILKEDTAVTTELKNLQREIKDLASKSVDIEKNCEKKIEAKAKEQEALFQDVVKKYNKQLNSIVKGSKDSETAIRKSMENLRDSLGGEWDGDLAGLNETIAQLKASLEEGKDQLEAMMKNDLAKHVQTFENVTNELSRKDTVSEIENRLSSTETVYAKLAEKISLISDQVNVLEFLIDGSVQPVPKTTAGPLAGSMNKFASKISTLEQRTLNQASEISDLKKERVDVTAFSATLGKPVVAHVSQFLVFDSVIFNKGQAYNNVTGVFTAPRSGIYAFNLVLLTRIKKEWIDIDLLADQKVLIRLTSKENKREDQTSVSVVTPLQTGQEVKPKIIYTAPNGVNKMPHLSFSVFSGFFVQPL